MKPAKVKLLTGKKLTSALDMAIRDYFHRKYPYPTCFVCGKNRGWFHPKNNPRGCQIGHYISRRVYQLRWDLKNLEPQCLTKESKIRKFNGLTVSIKDIMVGDKIWGFNDKTFEKELAIVEGKKGFIPDTLYEVELENGNVFYCTKDHMVVANGKWTSIEQLLHNVTAYDIMEL